MRDPGDVLQATYDAFTAKLCAIAGFDMPRRKSISVGAEPFDCTQFAVQGGAIYQGEPGRNLQGYIKETRGIALHSMDVTVVLVRNWPVMGTAGQPPTVDALNKAARQATSDAKALTDVFWASMQDESIAGPCDFVYFGGITWIGPDGGLVGIQLNMAVQL